MHVAIEQDGAFVGAVCLDRAEPYCVSNCWLEMLYRLPDGWWVHVYEEPPEPSPPTPYGRLMSEAEAIRHLLDHADFDCLPRLAERDWFRRYRFRPDVAADRGQASQLLLCPESLAKALLMEDPGMSNAELARKVGVHRSTVGRWGWLGRHRDLQRAAKADRPRGHRFESGGVECWRDVMDEEELERYDRGELG